MSAATAVGNVPVQIPVSPPSKLDRERQAFYRLFPQLLATHRGQYIAIHNEPVIDSGSARWDVALRVLQRVGNVDIYVGLVTDQPESIGTSGLRREVCLPGPQ